jgi:ubiquinone/menaquinone biosynthesis C-methylase UbiE
MSDQIDMAKVQEFGGRIVGMLNNAALAVMTSLGHRSGLFDALAAAGGPVTTQELATRANRNERYVREWLGAMVAGQFVTYHPDSNKYSLPKEHAALLTRAGFPMNLATPAQFISMMGSVEDKVLEAFEKGGGVPYSAYQRFHDIMAEDSAQNTMAQLVPNILPLVPGLIEKLEKGIDVLDVGCGQGRSMNHLARTFPNSRFTGLDLSESAIARARAEADQHGTKNVKFEVGDAASMTKTQAFDLITTFDSVHDQVHPDRVLANIAKALRPDGVYLMQEFRSSTSVAENAQHPLGVMIYAMSTMHCTQVSMSAGGPGLGAMWGHQTATKMMKDVGFKTIEQKQLPQDILQNYFIARLS